MRGKVYRKKAISSRSYCVFHQFEWFYIDKKASFTEPSAKTNVTCYLCDGKGCKVSKKSGWFEIIGYGIDPEKWSGYALYGRRTRCC